MRAPAAGTVTFAGSLPTYGRGVTILTADGYAVTLVHLGSIGVAKGDAVAEGASIGTMGWSGDAEHAVPSVHLGIRVGDAGGGLRRPARPAPAARRLRRSAAAGADPAAGAGAAPRRSGSCAGGHAGRPAHGAGPPPAPHRPPRRRGTGLGSSVADVGAPPRAVAATASARGSAAAGRGRRGRRRWPTSAGR